MKKKEICKVVIIHVMWHNVIPQQCTGMNYIFTERTYYFEKQEYQLTFLLIDRSLMSNAAAVAL